MHTIDEPPAVLIRHPRNNKIIIIGTYVLDKETGKRYGSVATLKAQIDECVEIASVRTPESSVLDLKAIPSRTNEFVSAQSTGSIIFWIIEEDGTIHKQKALNVFDPEVLVLSIGFDSTGSLMVLTLTTGEVSVMDMNKLELLFTTKVHDLEAWTGVFKDNLILSGGDDQKLACLDTRIEAVVLQNRNIHGAGVTSILPRSENKLLTGSYDDNCRVIDMRSAFREVSATDLGGGVWRLVPNKYNDDILACCMYGGARIMQEQSDSVSIIKSYTDHHQSMVYGGDWLDDSHVVTCSFYDKLLCNWSTR
ncbi:hypothetical protein CANCADRAFT_21531 [Tortispora caseinolytica NRRL Y-17796]|uniref:methylated diphthine methylhydrolase n=1 Tax=Tortispora caseinolytica NRRL Y-17796 TaxID=767744 RepID=A0A1E4TMD5_9ASCO|nr:hypothetical protein CANCADRAFT_21531 [Tortispora caseinolytica NRRL Y-17796]